MISITQVVVPYGLIGVDLYLTDLIEDIVSYCQQNQQFSYNMKKHTSYGFLIDMNGRTLVHPAFPQYFNHQQQSQTQQQSSTFSSSYLIDISYLENVTEFAQIRKRMLQEDRGNATASVVLKRMKEEIKLVRQYEWINILKMYVLCLVVTYRPESNVNDVTNKKPTSPTILSSSVSSALPLSLPSFSSNAYKFGSVSSVSVAEGYDYIGYNNNKNYNNNFIQDLLYHRLDLLSPSSTINVCRYFWRLTTMGKKYGKPSLRIKLVFIIKYLTLYIYYYFYVDSMVLYLSPSAFESPFSYLHNNRMSSIADQLRTMESIMAYLKDTTGLLANPGLRPHIRRDVNMLYRAMTLLQKRHQDNRGQLRNNIIRRYIASVNGVLLIYPGCRLDTEFEPMRRPWYRKAMKHAGKIISTEPYLDAAGAGYIVTVAHTIFEGRANALHSAERDRPAAVVAIDMPYAYFYRMILETTDICRQGSPSGKGIKCLLFENEGYLIAHPTMLEVSTSTQNYRRPYEHLTHKESYLSNDILYHKSLVHKLACANYQNRTLQRYYIFNTSLNEILSNVVHGERTKYAIALVRGSNIFAAVLNSTCDGGAFCPCSTIDRECLNCGRMDQMDCECPCECPMPLRVPTVSSSPRLSTSSIPILNHHRKRKQLRTIDEGTLLEKFQPMIDILNITRQYEYCEPSLSSSLFSISRSNVGGIGMEAYSPSSSSLEEEFITVQNLATNIIDDVDNNRIVANGKLRTILLPPCFNPSCDIFESQRDCLAVVGCEWCLQDMEGESFSEPFCSLQTECFNGVLASPSPYGEIDEVELLAANHGYNPGSKQTSYSAFGPITGAIVVLSVVIGLTIYCYRYNIDTSSQEQFYLDSLQEENYGLPLSRFNFDDCQTPDEPPSGGGGNGPSGAGGGGSTPSGASGGNGERHHGSAHHGLINPADISPYHVSTGSSYRRPPNGESSDHGYSTMTPHEDSSDHQCFALAEPLLLNEKRHSRSDTVSSLSTSISSPTNKQSVHPSHSNQYPSPASYTFSPKDCKSHLTSVKRHHGYHGTELMPTSQLMAAVAQQIDGDSISVGAEDENDEKRNMLPGATHVILAPVTVHRHMESGNVTTVNET